ncbi:MAG: glycosyltransferase, partial [Methylophilaceae bacterium]|nr:glycosyltransferase [Methylophilaceae bacterium]
TSNCDKESGVLCLVWIGSSSTRKYLEQILPHLEQASHKVEHLKLKVIADFELQSRYLNIQTIHWREDSEALELCKSHIGIAPMPEDNWTKGKCALKVLQYMAAGLPVISSKSGVNADVIDHKISGLLISDNSEWHSIIEMLAKDIDGLRYMGELGQKKVRTEYDIEVVFNKLLDHIKTLTK